MQILQFQVPMYDCSDQFLRKSMVFIMDMPPSQFLRCVEYYRNVQYQDKYSV